MSAKRSANARRAELRRRAVASREERVAEMSDRDFGIETVRLRPSGGVERTEIRFRVPDDPVSALWGLQRLRENLLAPLEVECVQGMRELGFSWAEIGVQLRITGEAARLRYGDRVT